MKNPELLLTRHLVSLFSFLKYEKSSKATCGVFASLLCINIA